MKLKKIISKILYRKNKQRINVLKTLYFNLTFLSFKKAIKFPIYIYGKCHIHNCLADISFTSPIKKGMVKIGISDPIRSYNNITFLYLNGDIEFGNNVTIRRGTNLQVVNNATLRLENNTFIGDNNTIICYNEINIKQNSRLGNNTTIMDTDFHYIINLDNMNIKPLMSPITIEENNWIGAFCTIKKGTKTPKGTILVGPYSTLCKDYTQIIPEYSLIGGSPAKLIRQGYRRVFNEKTEKMITKFFNNHSTNFIISENIDINSFCTNEPI